MEAKTNYTFVGVIVLVLIVGLLSTALWFTVGFNQKEYAYYTVYLTESVAGVGEQSPVKYNGVQVGFVKKIALNKKDPRQVELTLSIEKNIPITTSTTATLISQGITGVTYVGLSAGSSKLTRLQRVDGEPYPVIPARPSLFNQLDMIIKEVSENVNKVSMQTQRIFNEQNAAYIQNTLANIERISVVLATNSTTINQSLKNADVFLLNLANSSKEFPAVVKKFSTLVNNVGLASTNVSNVMVSGKSALDQLTQQAVPSATLLLKRLNDIAANLEKVSDELRQNPSVVIRGTAPPKPGPGE